MIRHLVLGGAIALTSTLSGAPAAHANPVCSTVTPIHPSGPPVGACIPLWPWGATCDTSDIGNATVDVHVVLCVPSIQQP